MSMQVYSPFLTITTSPYVPRGRQLHPVSPAYTRYFSTSGAYGVKLDGQWNDVDGKDDEFFAGCGTKIAYQLLVDGYPLFTKQMNAQRRQRGRTLPITRMKVVKQVAQVVSQFISQVQNQMAIGGRLAFGPNFITIEQIYLLELRQISHASFQPILGISIQQDPISPISPPSMQSGSYYVDDATRDIEYPASSDLWWSLM